MPEGPNFSSPADLSLGDHAHVAARALISTLPYVSGPAVEAFNYLVASPLEKRRQRWMEAVGAYLNRLGSIEALQSNEAFMSTLAQATRAAMAEHQDEKLNALRNAVLNAARPDSIDDTLQAMFVRMTEQFTVWHLRLLRLFQAPQDWFEARSIPLPGMGISGSSLQKVVEAAFPDLAARDGLWQVIAKDLDAAGVFVGRNLSTVMTGEGALEKRTTKLGDEFLAFISEPDAAQPN